MTNSFNNFCQRCGGTLGTGGCPRCAPSYSIGSFPQYPNFGWTCPKCGGGNAPWASSCPCVNRFTAPQVTPASEGTDNDK